MSDYLSNLVARTLATVPVLQPRQPSLFEPVGGGWGLGNRDWGVVAEVETAAFPPPIQPTRSETAAVTPPPTTLVQPQPVPERPLAARPEKKPAPTPSPMTIRERIIQQTVVEKKGRLIPAAPPTAAPPRPAKALAVPVPAAVQPRPPSPPPAPAPEKVNSRSQNEPPIRPLPTAAKQPFAPEPPLRIVERERPTSEPSPPPKPDKRQVAPPPTIRERILPRAAIAPPQREQAMNGRYTPEPPPAPTIQVHIGRIEVRATPPPPQPAAKSGPKAALTSLDDYLRQRNGGPR
jgi:hypothetical protein